MKLKIATGKSAYNKRIVNQEVTVEQLFKRLSKPTIRNEKDGSHFTLAEYKGNRRLSSHLIAYYGAVIDLDDSELTLDEIKSILKDYRFCLYTTHNHKNKQKGYGNRYRVVIPYNEPIHPSKHVQSILYLSYLLGGATNVDLSSKALGRLMYFPSCPSSREKIFQFYESRSSKPFFNPHKIKLDPEQKWEFEQMQQTEKAKFDESEEVIEGDRDNAMVRFSGKMVREGRSLDDVIVLAHTYNQKKLVPPLSDEQVEKCVKSVFNSHRNNHNDADWGFEEVERRIKQTDNIDEQVYLIGKSEKNMSAFQRKKLIKAIQRGSGFTISEIETEIKSVSKGQKKIEEEEKQQRVDKSIENLKKEFKEWVFVTRDNVVFNTSNGEYLKPESFNTAYGKYGENANLLKFLVDNSIIRCVYRREFRPGKPQIFSSREGSQYVNIYIPPSIKGRKGDVKPFLDHMEYMIPDKKEREAFLGFIAYNVQHPGKKVRWMPILKGGKGIGKSLIADLVITPIIGQPNMGVVKSKQIASEFNAWQVDTQLAVFHELKTGRTKSDRLDTTDNLKEFITDMYIQAHRKGCDPYTVLNVCNSMAFTNHDDAVMITPDERRFAFIVSKALPKSSRYYRRLTKWLKRNEEELRYFFENFNLRNFDPSEALQNEAIQELKEESMTWPMNIINDAMNDAQHPLFKDGCISRTNLIDYIAKESAGKLFVTATNWHKHGSENQHLFDMAIKDSGLLKYKKEGCSGNRYRVGDKQDVIYLHPKTGKKMQGAKSTIRICENQKQFGDEFDE